MEKYLTFSAVKKHGWDKLSVITADMIEKKKYTRIGNSAFEHCSYLTKITIPNSIKGIDSYAFADCKCLKNIEISNSVKCINSMAFHRCTSLISITIPNDVTEIATGAFSYCKKLKSVTIPNSVISIGYGVFEGCISLPVKDNIRYADTYLIEAVDKTLSTYTIKDGTKWIGTNAFTSCINLNSIIIPNSVINIGKYAFAMCNKLTNIIIPSSVKSIESSSFFGNNLKSIVVEKDNTVYDSRDNCNAIIYTKSNTLIIGCQNTVISNSITSIGDHAFCNCINLTSITIPQSVKNIGWCAFQYCTNLTSIIISNSVSYISNYAFMGVFKPIKIKALKTIAYKGFNKDMTCRDFLYEEGKTYEISKNKSIELCNFGFHACLNPLDCLNYYNGAINKEVVFHEVYLEDISSEIGNDTKVVARKITIGRKLTIQEMAEIATKMLNNK